MTNTDVQYAFVKIQTFLTALVPGTIPPSLSNERPLLCPVVLFP